MAMNARLDKLRAHGPQATKCLYCEMPFEEGMWISGERNRGKDASHAYHYWHDNCKRPWGWNPNAPTTLTNSAPTDATAEHTVEVGTASGWQRNTPILDKTPTSGVRPRTSNDEQAETTGVRAADTSNTELIGAVVNAINKTLMPQLESAVSAIDAEITQLKSDNVAQDSQISSNRINLSTLQTTFTNTTAEIKQSIIAAKTDTLAQLDARIAQAKAELQAQRGYTINVTLPNGSTQTTDVGKQHKLFPLMLKYVAAGFKNIWITGPAGSGKSTAAKMVAKALGFDFHIQPLVSDPTDLLGYMTATGVYSPTNFYRAYTSTKPTILLLDEVDGWDARAGIAANGALDNGHCAFPHGTFERGTCIIIATANTWGFGANDEFVGRNKLDATTLDRFITLEWDYDEDFERSLVGYGTGNRNVDTYVDAVIEARHIARSPQVRAKVQITPRANIDGALGIRAGLSREEIVTLRFQRFRSNDKWHTVGKAIEDWAKSPHIITRTQAAD